MKIAVLGGSFNPLHVGHAMLAETVVKELGFDKVLFVPTFIPPHKIMNTAVSPEQRLEMVRSFCKESNANKESHFFCEDCEIVRGGISYTSETLLYITEKYKSELNGTKPAFIMGQEVAAQFYKWKNPEKVTELADILIASRVPEKCDFVMDDFKNIPSGNYSEDYSDESYLRNFPYKYAPVKNLVFPVSSTEIRTRIALKKAWRYLVPEAVFQYIISNNLYGKC